MNYEVDFVGPNRWAPSHRRYVRNVLEFAVPEAVDYLSSYGFEAPESVEITIEGATLGRLPYLAAYDFNSNRLFIPQGKTELKHRKIRNLETSSYLVHEMTHMWRSNKCKFVPVLPERVTDEGLACCLQARYDEEVAGNSHMLDVLRHNAIDEALATRIGSLLVRLHSEGFDVYDEALKKPHDVGLREKAYPAYALGAWIIENHIRGGATVNQLIHSSYDQLFDWGTFELKELQ